MSLVNDMLRDLDARRRDAPTHGAGSEKLVPAAERAAQSAHRGRRRLGLLMLVLASVFVSLLALYLVLVGRGPSQIAAPQPRPPVAETVAQTNSSVNESELVAQAAAVAIQSVAEANNETLLMLEQRLQQLEAQNQALLAERDREQSLAPGAADLPNSPAQQAGTTLDAGAVSDGSLAPSQPFSQPFSQEWADATALPAQDDVLQQPFQTLESAAASTTRSPRELSFQDRDRQQVQLALQQWASGQQLSALQTLDSFAHENPDAHASRETLAKLLLQQGEVERAMQAVELGLALSPNNNAYRKIKARLLVADARAAEAVVLLTNLAPALSSDTEYHDLLASSYLANQQYDFAAQTYRALLSQNIEEGRWWYGLAAAFDAQGLTQDAVTSYERALQQPNLTSGLRQASQQRLQLIRQSSAAR